MKWISRICTALLATFVAPISIAQVVPIQPTPVFITANLTYVEANVVGFQTRPPHSPDIYPLYVNLNVAFSKANLPCLDNTLATSLNFNNKAPVMYSNRPDFKVMRETLQLAMALNKPVRVMVDRCASLLPPPSVTYIYPVIWAVEMLP